MRTITLIQKRSFLTTLLYSLFITISFAQVGINTSSPADGTILDITSNDKGILIPSVSISDLTTMDPITGVGATASEELAAEGLLVYNNDISTGKGFYYWNGVRWVGIDGDRDWKLQGNAGSSPGTDFVGTSDATNLILATNSNENMRLVNGGQVTVNEIAPFAGDRFTATGATNEFAINGYSFGTGVGLYGQNTATGTAILAENYSTGLGLYSVNYNTGIAGFFESYSGNFSIVGLDGPILGNNITFGGDGLIGATDTSGLENGVWGINNDANGTAIVGGTGGVHVLNADGSGISGSSPSLGVFGYVANGNVSTANQGNAGARFALDSDGDVDTLNDRAGAILAGFDNVAPIGAPAGSRNSYFGGYFSGGAEDDTPTYAYVGMRYRTNNTGGSNGNTIDYKIIGTGSVSTLVNDPQGIPRTLFAPEAPEIVFQDYGVGQLIDGEVVIQLDPLLTHAIYVDETHPLKVFVTLEGECNGIYVTNKSSNGFTVKELQQGRSNVSFSWQIVASRADTKDASGNIVSKHIGTRFPIGPAPRPATKKKGKEFKEPNKKNLNKTPRVSTGKIAKSD